MSSLLGEPFLLASYPTASQHVPRSVPSNQYKRSRHISATCSSKGNGEGFVTISVQGDGVHVLELSSTHASVSHTLGPSTSFAAPAATRFEDPGASTSYAVMQSASDGVDSSKRGRTVWRLRDQQSRRPEDPPEPRLIAVFPQLVEHIWAPSALPSHVIAVSPSGQIMLADQDLNLTSSSAARDAGGILFRRWLFSSEECTFLPRNGAHSDGVVVLCFMLDSNRLKLQLTHILPMGELRDPVECDMGLYENVIDISCDSSGYASVLTQTGEWKKFRISLNHDTVTATPLDGPLHLSGFTLAPYSSRDGRGIDRLTLLSVGSSRVLLAGIAGGSSSEITLLLWDLQYSVVLASQTIAIPSTLTHAPKSPPNLELVPASNTQALLVMSPAAQTNPQRKETATQSRSTILVVPFEVDPVSTIALAMGKARDTQKWLQNTHNSSCGVDQDEERARMVQLVQSAIEQGQPQAAEAAFFAWVEEEIVRLKLAQEKEHSPDDGEAQPGYDSQTSKAARKASGVKKKWKNTPTKPVLSHHFVSSVLNMVLRPGEPSESSYSSKIVFYLVDRKAVGNAMVEGGLIPALRTRRDWESIYSTLINVSDIPEVDLIGFLAEVVVSHRQKRHPKEDHMQVDAPADILPPLAQFLAALVNYTTSPPMLRLALKHRLTDVRDVVCVLEVLEGWMAHWRSKNLDSTPFLEVLTDNISQTTRKKKVRPSQNHGMPPLENIMSFLQCVLDTHYFALLQYSACHDIIERLAEHVKHQLASVDEMDRLRGPLESFARILVKEANLERIRKEGDSDWRKKRREADQAAELAVGLYQIEELVI